MNNQQHQDDLIDLGAASDETKGAGMYLFDQEGTKQIVAGLTDD